jgi:hypothetical protein
MVKQQALLADYFSGKATQKQAEAAIAEIGRRVQQQNKLIGLLQDTQGIMPVQRTSPACFLKHLRYSHWQYVY